MRNVIGLMTAIVLVAASASAQTSQQSDTHKMTKILAGATAVVIGVALAAKSSQTTTTTTSLGMSETSSFSTSQLVTGLVIGGAGGILLWDGLRDHGPASPTTAVGVGIRKGSGAQLLVRRTW